MNVAEAVWEAMGRLTWRMLGRLAWLRRGWPDLWRRYQAVLPRMRESS